MIVVLGLLWCAVRVCVGVCVRVCLRHSGHSANVGQSLHTGRTKRRNAARMARVATDQRQLQACEDHSSTAQARPKHAKSPPQAQSTRSPSTVHARPKHDPNSNQKQVKKLRRHRTKQRNCRPTPVNSMVVCSSQYNNQQSPTKLKKPLWHSTSTP